MTLNCKKIILSLALTFFVLFNDVQGSKEVNSVRAAWIDYRQLLTISDTENVLKTLSNSSVNRIYVDIFNNGIAYYNSTAMAQFSPSSIGPDVLANVITVQNKFQMDSLEIWAWFEYGLMAQYGGCSNAYCQKCQTLGWVLGNENGFVWLDARKPAMIQQIAKFLSDVQQTYPSVRGVQLDDHFGLPVSLAGTDLTTMNTAAQTLLSLSKSSLSLAPAPASFALAKLNVNWQVWAQKNLGFLDYAPQLYTASYNEFEIDLEDLDSKMGSYLQEVLVGIRCQGTGSPTSWEDLSQMVKLTLSQKNLKGLSIWNSLCFEVYPNLKTISGW